MSEYAGQAKAQTSAPAHRAHAPVVASRDDRNDPVRLAREVSALDAQVGELRRAHEVNDANAWHAARTQLDHALGRVAMDLERAEAAATPDAQPQIVAVRDAYQMASAAAALQTSAPAAYRTVAREAEITAIATARVDADLDGGFVDKERALRTELELLSPVDAALLAARITRRAPGDAIAAAIGRFVPERRSRVLEVLRGAPRRAALARDEAGAMSAPTPAEPAAESPDADWLAVLGGARTEADIARAVAALDDNHRHALLARFREYKPGQGDELGARFALLDASDRGRITTALLAADVAAPAHLLESVKRGRAAAAQLVAFQEPLGVLQGKNRFLNVLDSVDDPDARAIMLAEFERLTGKPLREFIAGADWHSKRDAAQALVAVAPARDDAERRTAALSADDRAALAEQARGWATELLSCVRGNDKDTDENTRRIAHILGPRSPQEVEAIRAAFRAQGHASIYEELDRALSHGNEDEAVAGLAGDPIHAAAAGLANAGNDTPRVAEILRGLTKEQLDELERRDPQISERVVLAQHEGANRDEVVELFAHDHVRADAAHVADLFRGPDLHAAFGWSGALDARSKRYVEAYTPDHIVAELEHMAPAEIVAAAAAWDRDAHARGQGPTWDQMIDEKFADGDRVTYLRIRALAHGNRALAKAVALEDAMTRNDDHDVEDALANPELNAADPDARATAVAERVATESYMRSSDLAARNVFSAFVGPSTTGRSVKAQLDAHYEAAPDAIAAHLPTFARDSAAVQSELRANAREQGQAVTELWQDGDLAAITKVHRAGSTHERAQLLEGLDEQQLEQAGAASKARYGRPLIEGPDRERYASWARSARANGDKRSLEDIEVDLARAVMSADELRIENVREFGPVEGRPAWLQYALDRQVVERQHSWVLAEQEREREMAGGALGSETLVDSQLSAEGALLATPDPFGPLLPDLAPGVTPGQFEAAVHATSAASETQHAERIALGERMARVVTIAGKIAAMAAGQPELYAMINFAAGASGVLVKYAIEGQDYQATADLENLAIDTVLDVATVGIGSKLHGTSALAERTTEEVVAAGVSNEAKRAVTSTALHTAVNLGMSSAATVAHGLVDHQSASDIFEEVILGGVAYVVPRALRAGAEGMIGKGTELRNWVGRVVGFTTQVASGGVLNGGGYEGFINAAGQATGEAIHEPEGVTAHGLADRESHGVATAPVHGASFKGRALEVADADAAISRAHPALVNVIQDRGLRIEHVDVEAFKPHERASAANTYVIGLPDGTHISIRIAAGPLDGQTVARTVPNPTKEGSSPVQGDEATVTQDVHGRFVIQMSDRMDPSHVERAVAHAVAEALASRELSLAGRVAGRDVLRTSAATGDLSPHDHGRIAEIAVLARELGEGGSVEASVRAELDALVEEMGVRAGVAGGDARAERIRAELPEGARDAFEDARTAEHAMDESARQRLVELRDRSAADRAEQARYDEARTPLHEVPTTGLGHVATEQERHGLAVAAAAERTERSVQTHGGILAQNQAGEIPVYEVMCGGNASLAARRPDVLVIDANARWAVDRSEHVAQTADQMRDIRAAGMGNPYEFAGPNQRVPREALLFMQDSIASQGPLLDGRGTLSIDPVTKDVVMTVRMNDGSPEVKVRVKGTMAVASGFPPERTPGNDGMTARQALTALAQPLAGFEQDPNVGPAASQVRQLLASGSGPDVVRAVNQALEASPGLLAALPADVTGALASLQSEDRWARMREDDRARGGQHLFLGDEANAMSDAQLSQVHRAVVAGTGGTGVSAAEIVLKRNTTATVVMVGKNAPAGLLENEQFRRLVAEHGSPELARRFGIDGHGDGRFEFQDGFGLGAPTRVGDQYVATVTADAGATAAAGPTGPLEGDTYISALGRANDLPPVLADLVSRAERAGSRVTRTPRFDKEDHFTHYSIKFEIDGRTYTFDVTGAASRFMERPRGSDADKKLGAASDLDAPPESGTFDGGWAASAVQAGRYRWARAQSTTPESSSDPRGDSEQ